MEPPGRFQAVIGAGLAKWLFGLGVGMVVAAIALLIRMKVPFVIAGSQAIFSYPAIIIATLLYGARAGSVAGIICLPFLWYFVVPPRRSFAIEDWPAAITLVMYIMVGAALVWGIARMRTSLRRHKALVLGLESEVERRTAERNRLWERSRELLAIVTAAGNIRIVNPALANLTDIDATPVDRSFESLLVEEDRHRFRSALQEGGMFEARLTTPVEPAWVSWSCAAGDGETYLVGRDFTAEHQCGEQLRQSQKMELVGQMAGGLAHDFGNLVPPISMTLHLLGKRHADDARTRELIEGAEESVERAATLIKRLLALSRPSRVDREPKAIGPLLDQLAPLLRQVIGSRTLDVDIAKGLPPIRVDTNQLDMALLNLVVNARDATAEDGRLKLTVSCGTGGVVTIALADDGHGMDPETLSRAIEPFYSTKASGKGSGLGLSMVHNFAVAAGGKFSIESSVETGTCATISLPHCIGTNQGQGSLMAVRK